MPAINPNHIRCQVPNPNNLNFWEFRVATNCISKTLYLTKKKNCMAIWTLDGMLFNNILADQRIVQRGRAAK
jgi:hypothetical protein